jgi:hypothetical protein
MVDNIATTVGKFRATLCSFTNNIATVGCFQVNGRKKEVRKN